MLRSVLVSPKNLFMPRFIPVFLDVTDMNLVNAVISHVLVGARVRKRVIAW